MAAGRGDCGLASGGGTVLPGRRRRPDRIRGSCGLAGPISWTARSRPLG